ncbi:50S ribosomal protein L25/general stress protein Ctc [Salisediminibacterium selenitireducens]|uniref:Large ribosomal subunit protein bL25 n=1 Tax=Bacillus selenitireducens (strain ATCC 700615 / DSM 15326 / MLS10) TaxID=439292 RepID=D6XV47_BACIE|nr:50S ribosomal protein L25/general stress protein Ctc [Salisediminibacterium selenitireducens]ADH97605.1 ribosomal 5S rRNA E-loop binding protein Ctc/L25/TL5 [[Bacillus] selenitireducens MLS10]
MATILKAAPRNEMKGSTLTTIRSAGWIPAVVYGKEYGNKPVQVEEIDFIKTYRAEGKTGVFSLDVEGEKTDVMIYDIQYDMMKNQYVHIDFYAANMKEEMDADVPVNVVGEAQGVKDGGVLQQGVFELSVRALPKELPDSIDVNVEELEVNDSIFVKDLKSGADFEFNNDPEEMVVSIVPPTDEPEEETAEEEEGAEPELVAGEEGEEENMEE